MEDTSHHQYAGLPLDRDGAFRLLTLRPGRGHEPITIHLENSQLTNPPPYEALSYVWGDASDTTKISILGSDSDNDRIQVPVTINCHAALRRLRFPDRSRILWVDAICINQSDISERNHQLSLMGRIYRTARRVAVYLGEAADASDDVMRWVRQLHWPGKSRAARAKITDIEPPAAHACRPRGAGIAALLRRPWFHRVWVLQEIALARAAVVVCGAEEVGWECFLAFRYWVWGARRSGFLDVSDVVSYGRPIVGSLPSWVDMLEVLAATRHCGASDPSDKLYALLPLFDRPGQRSSGDGYGGSVSGLRADYGLSTAIVFTDLAVRLLELHGLELLRWVVSPASVEGLPSWVPDWSVNAPSRQFEGHRETPFHAGSRHETALDWSQWKRGFAIRPSKTLISKYISKDGGESVELNVRGVCLGTIKTVSDVSDAEHGHFPLRNWQSLVSKTRNKEQVFPQTNTTFEGEYKNELSSCPITLSTDLIHLHPVESITDMIGEEDVINNDNESISMGEYLLSRDTSPDSPGSERMTRLMSNNWDGRRLFITDADYIGLAPATARAGDVVMIIENATVPFVLRPQSGVPGNREFPRGDGAKDSDAAFGSKPVFQLIEQAYVKGVMGGEIWDLLDTEASELYVEELLIR